MRTTRHRGTAEAHAQRTARSRVPDVVAASLYRPRRPQRKSNRRTSSPSEQSHDLEFDDAAHQGVCQSHEKVGAGHGGMRSRGPSCSGGVRTQREAIGRHGVARSRRRRPTELARCLTRMGRTEPAAEFTHRNVQREPCRARVFCFRTESLNGGGFIEKFTVPQTIRIVVMADSPELPKTFSCRASRQMRRTYFRFHSKLEKTFLTQAPVLR